MRGGETSAISKTGYRWPHGEKHFDGNSWMVKLSTSTYSNPNLLILIVMSGVVPCLQFLDQLKVSCQHG